MSIKLMTEVFARPFKNSGTKFVLLALADNASDEGFCYPKIATIVKKCSMPQATVYRHIAKLEQLGYLERTNNSRQPKEMRTTVGKGRKISSNCYLINLPKIVSICTDHLSKREVAPPKMRGGGHLLLTIEPSVNLVHLDNGHDPDNLFEKFYKAFPRKVKKPRALAVWSKNKLWRYSDDIMANLEQRKKCEINWVACKDRDITLVMHPTTYLSGECWTDNLEVTHDKKCKSCTNLATDYNQNENF